VDSPAGKRERPSVSAVIPTLGDYEVLGRVLDGYARQDAPPGSFELIVVVDKADPHPEKVDELLSRRPFPARRLTGPLPGASANRNAGWTAARAPVVLLTDNDTIPSPRLVSEHLEWHRRHTEENVAVVGHVSWAGEVHVTPFMRWLEQGVQFDFGSIKGDQAQWPHLYTCNCSIKRAFFERVGGYDEERLPYGYEDLDWAYRASRHGLRVLYNRRAVVHHLRHDMTLEFWKRRVKRAAISERQFVALHPELDPWFFQMFRDALQGPPYSDRGARLARYVPRWLPWLGPKVWRHAEHYWQLQLAPHFMRAWDEDLTETEALTE
jgi:GT2 family glycosyltransferase